LLFVLVAAVAATAILSLVYGIQPALTRSGITITAAALVVMPLLAWFKRRAAQTTSSRALAADAVQSGTCAYLAGITLAGLVVNAMFRIGWIDSAAALATLPILISEGRKAIRGESCCS
jgi:divalent metal cation (Fe/Co/Zn/Cd) transporter